MIRYHYYLLKKIEKENLQSVITARTKSRTQTSKYDAIYYQCQYNANTQGNKEKLSLHVCTVYSIVLYLVPDIVELFIVRLVRNITMVTGGRVEKNKLKIKDTEDVADNNIWGYVVCFGTIITFVSIVSSMII